MRDILSLLCNVAPFRLSPPRSPRAGLVQAASYFQKHRLHAYGKRHVSADRRAVRSKTAKSRLAREPRFVGLMFIVSSTIIGATYFMNTNFIRAHRVTYLGAFCEIL